MLIQGQYKFIFVFSHLLALFWISQTSIQNAVTDILKNDQCLCEQPGNAPSSQGLVLGTHPLKTEPV